MNMLDKQYTDLLQDILDNGVKKGDRTGTGTISVFGRQIRHKMSDGFPLLTTKKMYFKGIATELLWFLRGDTNIKYLVDNDCHIWDGDAYKNYCKYANDFKIRWYDTKEEFIDKIKTDYNFADTWGDLGPIYGKQWRRWKHYFPKTYPEVSQYEQYVGVKTIDQITNLIKTLKTNPDDRRMMVTAWNPADLKAAVLPPCHYGFQVYTRELSDGERAKIYWDKRGIEDPILPALRKDIEKENIPTRAISLMWNQRSVDTFLGLPFNIASYGLLLEIIAKECNMVPDELIGNLGDTHIYLNHIEQAKEQIGKELTTEERNEWFHVNWNKNNPQGKRDWKDFELDQQGVPKRTREPFPLPKLSKLPDYLCKQDNWECYKPEDIKIENYQSHPPIKAPLSN